MTERRPWFVLLFILSLAASLVGMSVFFPAEGFELPFGLHLKYPTFDHLMGHNKPEYVDISKTIAMADSLVDESNDMKEIELIPRDVVVDSFEVDSLADTVLLVRRFKRVNVDSLRAAQTYLQPIQFKNKDASVLHKFFKALDKAAFQGGKTHVIHYGDSQIEGDRMTSYIRDRLQKRFGGFGIGLVSVSDINVVPIMGHSTSDNWYRYPGFIKEGAAGGQNGYGVLCAYSTFTPYPPSASLTEMELTEAWVRYNAGDAVFNTSKKFQQVKMYYGPVHDAVKLTFPVDDTTFADYFKGKKPLNNITLGFNEPRQEIELRFQSKISPPLYAISLEGKSGVQVSNVAMRGSSGTVFHNMNESLLGEMLTDLNTSLIILQYGGNVMPYMERKKQATDYGNWFYRQIKILQKACPTAAIILIGPADMSRKVNDYYETYPLLEDVRDALKKAAFDAGAGYWDMYEAMGGKNSMPSWVEAAPPLAIPDYTHFSPRGARIVSEFFYKALIIEYETYNNQKAIP